MPARSSSLLLVLLLAAAAGLCPAASRLHVSPPSAASTSVRAPDARDAGATLEEAAVPTFAGHDRFDHVCTVDDLRELEDRIREVTRLVRPSVVLLRATGGRSGVSVGTAVIIGRDGLLATCGHVGVRPGRSVTAVMSDGTELSGVTLGQVFADGVDCGLVQLDTGGRALPSVAMGTSGDLAVGDWVIAMGYTHGLANGARPALVRVGRVLRNDGKELVIDAPIDAGDSGGPSFNLRGEVVGLNSRCGRESWQNVATPIDLLRERFDTLVTQREPDAEASDEPRPRDRRRRRDPSSPFPDAGVESSKLTVERAVPLDAVSARAAAAMVGVHCDDRRVAYGLVTAARGLVVTKASQLEAGALIEVETAGGRRHAAEEVARDATLDLALLRFTPDPGERLVPVRWSTGATVIPGQALVTPRAFGQQPALGFAAIEERESEADAMDGPFLGVETRPASTEELDREGAEEAVTVVRVLSGSAAALAGLQPGDIVLQVNDAAVGSPMELRRVILGRKPGDLVGLRIANEAGERVIEVALGRRGDTESGMRRGNTATPISRRSSGLGSLLAHDAVTDPTQMGGPLVDLDGHVVGMNIARYDRTATHALDADTMARACRDMLRRSREARQAAWPARR